jgi:hypothetical protein
MTRPVPEITPRRHAALGEVLSGQRWASVGLGPRGEALFLVADPAGLAVLSGADVTPGFASFPHSRTAQPVAGRALVTNGDWVQSINLSRLTVAHPHLQSLPDGEVLLVGARCRLGSDGMAEANAQVYGPDGQLVREFVLGDGIQDVQVSETGALWVSYFDEGVFGNYGWSPGVAGLVEYDPTGRERWSYVPPYGVDSIVDCYALNVARDAAWAYYYSQFPLVRIDDQHRIRVWQTSVAGARTFAMHGDRVVFAGGYGQPAERLVVGRLHRDEVVVERECQLVLPADDPFRTATVVGRGAVLHAFTPLWWYQLEVTDLD